MTKIIKKRNSFYVTTPILQELRYKFSIPNPAKKVFKLRKKKFIPERLYSITPTGKFEPGMFFLIYKFLKDNIGEVEVSGDVVDVVKPGLQGVEIYDNLKHPLREYQIECLNKCIEFGRGVLEVGTGGGKTLIIASLLSSIFQSDPSFKCLILVPDKGLRSQTFNDFNEYGVPFSFFKWDSTCDPDQNANVIITNRSLFLNRIEDNNWLLNVDIFIVDECHGIKKDNNISKEIKKIKTNNKFGFTGSLSDNLIDTWKTLGIIGPVIYKKRSSELIDSGFLTNVEVKKIYIQYVNSPPRNYKQNNFKNELEFIYTNRFRNNLLKTLCENFKNNTLILVNHIQHGEELERFFKNIKKEVFFIQGSVAVEDREKIQKLIEEKNNVVCIAMSSIFSTGINIKNIHMIIFAAGGKSFIRVVQSIGRGLRLHPEKKKLFIIDIVDELVYGFRHSQKREEVYKKEKINTTSTFVIEK